MPSLGKEELGGLLDNPGWGRRRIPGPGDSLAFGDSCAGGSLAGTMGGAGTGLWLLPRGFWLLGL